VFNYVNYNVNQQSKVMSKKKYINQSEFGRRIKAHRATISLAVKNGLIFKESQGIDPDHPINKAYAKRFIEDNSGNRREVKMAKAAESEVLSKILERLDSLGNSQNGKSVSAPDSEPSGKEPELNISADSKSSFSGESTPENTSEAIDPLYSPDELGAFASEKKEKAQLAKANAAKANLLVAKEMKILVPQKSVREWWRLVISSIEKNIINFDEKVTEEVCAICGVTDPAIVAKARRRIGDQASEALTLVKEAGEAFNISV
jgi:hypothetical protein